MRWLPVVVALGALCSGCTQAEKEEFFRAMAAIFIVAMVSALLMVFIALVGLVLSLVMLALNLTRPSMVSVIGALVFAGMFFLGGVGTGAVVIGGAATAQVAIQGGVWALLHVFYAGALVASSVHGHRKMAR